MNLHAAAAYARHLLTARSKAGHGVHSPFMFSFFTEVIGGRSERAIINEVENLRREMLSDRRVVRVRDLGAGSAVMRGGALNARQDSVVPGGETNARQDSDMPGGEMSDRQGASMSGGEKSDSQNNSMLGRERRIRDIAAAAAVPKREAALLARIAGSLENTRSGEHGAVYRHGEQSGISQKPGKMSATDLKDAVAPDFGYPHRDDTGRDKQPVILELGTSLGISTLALALGAPTVKVITIEGCPELAVIARENLLRHGAHNAEVICLEFSEALAELQNRGIKVALAFIDGNHRGAALIEYVHRIREMGEEMIIIADDIHMNGDMSGAWRSLTAPVPEQRAAEDSGAVSGELKSGPQSSAGNRCPEPGPESSAGHPHPERGTDPSAGHPHTERGTDHSAGHPHPGRGTDPSAGHPHPERGTDPSAGHPHPGRGTDTSAGHPHTERGTDPSAGHPHTERGNRTIVQPGRGIIAPASLETFRMGMLFYREKLTPGHYRVLY